MAKKATLSSVPNISNNASSVNENLEKINNQLNNTLSLDGSTPNAMTADLDLNGNNILNVSSIDTEVLTINGSPVGLSNQALLSFDTRSAANVQAAKASLSNGEVFLMDGLPYRVDTSKTGTSSVTNDLGEASVAAVEPVALNHFGAVGDGATDDTTAFQAAYDAGHTHVEIYDHHRIASAGITKDMSFTIHEGGNISLPSSTYFPNKTLWRGTETQQWQFDRTLYSDNKPADIDDAYTRYSDSHGLDINWVSQWGYNELTVGGNMVGQGSGGEIPGGQTRLGRTLASALRLDGSSTGEGDQYLIDGTMGVSQHSRTNLVTRWAGQSAGALGGGQITANTAQVTLYGIGDLVLKDSGYGDVAMWGHVTQLNKAGTDAAAYGVPRYGYFAVSEDQEVDGAFLVSGAWDVGMDTTRATLGSNSALTMAEGQGIYFDGTPNTPLTTGKFHATTLGGAYIDKQTNYLRLAFNSNDTLQVRDTRLDIKPSASSATAFRVYGNGTNPFLAAGAVGNAATLGAYTGSTENTSLSLLTAAAGVEGTALTLASDKGATFFGDVSIAGKVTAGDETHTANNQLDVNFFGDGSVAQSGAYKSAVNIFGGSNQTRHLSLFQELAGDAVVASTYGDLVLRTDAQNASVFITPHGTGRVNMDNPTYADDSAAGTGGLVAGDVYQTSTGELRIKL
jgi:hypothetical protein